MEIINIIALFVVAIVCFLLGIFGNYLAEELNKLIHKKLGEDEEDDL